MPLLLRLSPPSYSYTLPAVRLLLPRILPPDAVIFSGLGLYGEYAAFKGVAVSSSAKMRRYLLLEAAIIIMSLLFSIMKVANWNGWMRLEDAAALRMAIAPFWFWATVVEATVWTVGYIVGAIAWYHMYTLEANGPLAFSAKATRGAKTASKAAAGAKAAHSFGGMKLSRV